MCPETTRSRKPRISGADVVQEARRWVGTPYRHQAAVMGAGCDCIGLVRGVAECLGIMPVKDWTVIGAYSRTPSPSRMGAQMRRWLLPVTSPESGDIAWIEWREGMPMHLAILADGPAGPSLIHSYETVGRVVEHSFSGEWPARVQSWWRIPAVKGAN
jgi:NlpC/P60 family putative phage cell wall peptidase